MLWFLFLNLGIVRGYYIYFYEGVIFMVIVSFIYISIYDLLKESFLIKSVV